MVDSVDLMVVWLQVRQRKAFGRRVADLQTVQVISTIFVVFIISIFIAD